MRPTFVLVGKTNVGKSTLFNRLTRSRDALVADVPGLTRDRHYGIGRVGDEAYLVVDTGGLEPVISDGIQAEMTKQTLQAIAESDAVLFVVDGRQGLTAQDQRIAEQLRKNARHIWVVVNKTEGMPVSTVVAEFYALGLGDPAAISAAHGDGVAALIAEIFATRVKSSTVPSLADASAANKIAILGRPNVGKSTLVNSILGQERMIAFNAPGTTRDSVYIDFERAGRPYIIIDTAGVRRRGKISETVEKFSVIKSLQAAEDAHVVVLVLDAQQEISDQDASLAGFIVELGRALVIAVNKWDGLDPLQRTRIKHALETKLHFTRFAKVHFIAALHGDGVDGLFRSIDAAYASAHAKLSTPRLTRALQLAIEKQKPPRAGLNQPKLRYAHQGGSNPPVVVVHGSALDHVPADYWRYLSRMFVDVFELEGTPLRVKYKCTVNPYMEDKAVSRAKPSFRQTLKNKKTMVQAAIKRSRP